MSTKHKICPASEIGPGERKTVNVDGLSIGIFNINGELHALNNLCPHQLAPLCEGDVSGLVTAEETDPDSFKWEKDGYIIRCPWHNWEFDITTGGSAFNPHKVKTRTYNVEVESNTNKPGTDDRMEKNEEVAHGKSEEIDNGCGSCSEEQKYGTSLRGDEPPVETYDVDVENEIIVLYL